MSYIELLLLFNILIRFRFSRSGKKVYYLLKKSFVFFFFPLENVFLVSVWIRIIVSSVCIFFFFNFKKWFDRFLFIGLKDICMCELIVYLLFK